MKPSKSPRATLPHRGRSNRSLESHGKSSSPPRQSKQGNMSSETTEKRSGQSTSAPNTTPAQQSVHSKVTSYAGQDIDDLETMRRRMSEALAHKQQMMAATAPTSTGPTDRGDQLRESASNVVPQQETGSDDPILSGTVSNDSAKTIRATFDMAPGDIRTPSYPFPRMNFKLNRGTSHRSAPSHKPFTLLSPTNEPMHETGPMPQSPAEPTSSEMSTPQGQISANPGIPEDPNYPTPDLYEIILMLNAEPGMDMWWANATEVLSEAYGAERASLALPGDITDLENVPWGQRATFNIYSSESGGASQIDSTPASEVDVRSLGGGVEISQPSVEAIAPAARRPPLHMRHSIAGPLPEGTSRSTRQRPAAPTRAISSVTPHHDEPSSILPAPKLTRQAPTPRTQSTGETESPVTHEQYNSSSSSSALRCYVHRSLQPLEAEGDALLVRTGVASLFGKRKPVVLTRAYSEAVPFKSSRKLASAPSDDGRSNLSSKRDSRRRISELDDSSASTKVMRAFDEFEQPEPSPWSQSPSPSPAARPDPIESPFFVRPLDVDETAFEQNPPVYDYAATANQPLSAIGADMAKTLIHIPLIQPVPARGARAPSLRFPIAILSFISPMNPYPRNLRHSLIDLLPHLASSYSLAQQYSALQDRARGGAANRHGGAFGLGGTFSDEGSELELVTELSDQVAQDKARSKPSSYQGSVASPLSERAPNFRESPTSSVAGTPLLGHLGLSSGAPPTPGRSGADMVEGYFTARRSKPGQHPVTPGLKTTFDESVEKQKTSNERYLGSRGSSKGLTASEIKNSNETPVPTSPRATSTTSESEYADHLSSRALEKEDGGRRRASNHRDSQLRDEGEKPLPELISSLMLNAVPLQLFLAKPGTGDLVWTNRKFDAFRSQGEGRVRDPWKNVHVADRNGLAKMWNEALKSGGQFTHYIRVKRFNNDSDFRWFVFRASTLLSHNGRLLYWIGSFLDVHEQYIKNVEASEREATMARDAKIRALADAIPQVLFEALEGEGIVAVNQQWHAYSGQTLEDARGLGFAKHVHRDDLHKCCVLSPDDVDTISRSSAAVAQSDSSSSSSSNKTAAPPLQRNLFAPDSSSLERMIKTGAVTVEKDENGRLSYLTEIRLRSKGREYRWFLVRLVRVETALLNNGRASWYGTCTDIEIRKALERELGQANEKVHSEMESKTKFFANMSHEIRTPLNGILGSMPWLVESTLDHDQRRTVDTIQNSANNLRELVDNILDVTKVEAGKMALLPKWFHVRTLCEEVVDTVSSRAIERGLELNYSLDASVPPTVKGDPFRLRQVLLNLMGNSVKFTEQGEVYMRCSLKKDPESTPVSEPHALLNFEVVDTGRGFNQNDFQRLFKQFGQIGTGSNHDAGSGLGLFLSKQLVEMHGGELSVKSQAGEGSTFSFFVKVEVGPTGTEITSPKAESQSHTRRHSMGVSGSPKARSDSKTPTMTSIKGARPSQGIIQTPGLSKYTMSPETQSPSLVSSSVVSPSLASPPLLSSEGSGHSIRSNSGNIAMASSMSSQVPTPESVPRRDSGASPSERQILAEKAMAALPAIRRSKSDNDGSGLAPELAHPAIYSIVVICPAEHARAAIKQHIEHVVPHQIAVNVTTIADVGTFLELMNGPASPTFTHIVLDIPATSDIMLFMRQMTHFTAPVIPTLVVLTDHYQKRDIQEDFATLTSVGRKAFLIHKPVKPSVFAMIFDPAQLRNLSKDRAREVAQTSSDDFKNVANLVKETVGNRQFRVLLVEDSDVNRMVIMRYLRKVALANDQAKDGQECTDMVLGQAHGFYSLIICDIQMPKKNGYQACMEIRRWEAENGQDPVPIMALTANAMPEERAAAGAAGFTDYLTKPVDFNTLGTMMMNLLDPKVPHTFLRDRPPES